MMYLKPSFSCPMMFSQGTRTSSNVIYVVPLLHTPMQFICLVVTPGPRSTRSRLMPPAPGPPVRHATVKKSAKMPFVIHFFSPLST